MLDALKHRKVQPHKKVFLNSSDKTSSDLPNGSLCVTWSADNTGKVRTHIKLTFSLTFVAQMQRVLQQLSTETKGTLITYVFGEYDFCIYYYRKNKEILSPGL